jgi:fermentation-respiration switch protein FrsA (DUF1100 family)
MPKPHGAISPRRVLYPWLPARRLSRQEHATREYVRGVRCPVLVIHSRNDEIIPYHHGESIFAAANEPRAFLELEGGHNDAWLRDEQRYLAGVRSFLSAAGLTHPAAPGAPASPRPPRN